MTFVIGEERISAEDYIEFLKKTDLGSQYPKERFHERISKLVNNVSISLVARDSDTNEIIGVCFGITDFAYWLFMTDLGVIRTHKHLGVGRALIKKLHQIAGGKRDIIMYACINESALGFYEKMGMVKTDDVMCLNEIDWTDFEVK